VDPVSTKNVDRGGAAEAIDGEIAQPNYLPRRVDGDGLEIDPAASRKAIDRQRQGNGDAAEKPGIDTRDRCPGGGLLCAPLIVAHAAAGVLHEAASLPDDDTKSEANCAWAEAVHSPVNDAAARKTRTSFIARGYFMYCSPIASRSDAATSRPL